MKAIGIILAGGDNFRMKELSEKRATAAMPIAGSYLSIDFVLSNMSNSHVQRVAVLTQFNPRSLISHMSSSKWWDFGRKQGGLYLFPPMTTKENSMWYRGTADAIAQNLDFLKKCHEPYVIIAGGDCVYKMDYNQVLDYHMEKNADITVVCKKMPSDYDVSRFGVVRMDEDCRIVDFDEKPVAAKSHTVSTGIYVIRRRLLIEMLTKCMEENRYDFVRDVLIRYKDIKGIYAYLMDGYWSNIATVESYQQTNMDFLDPDLRRYFFREEPYIYSKVDDLAPAKYNEGSQVSDSLVASGCIINSKVEHSVLFKKVYVAQNCEIKDSIIMEDVRIGDNVRIENCIVESGSTIPSGTVLTGEHGVRIVREDNKERYLV